MRHHNMLWSAPYRRRRNTGLSVALRGRFMRDPASELRRIPLLGTPVNKAAQASLEARSDYTRGGRRYLRLLWVLLLSVLAREVLRTVQNDHHDRSNAPPRGKQPRHSWQVRSREHFTEESRIGVEGGMQQHGQ